MNKTFKTSITSALVTLVISSANGYENMTEIIKNLDEIEGQLNYLQIKENDICGKRDEYQNKIQETKNKLSSLKETKNKLNKELEYVDQKKYLQLNLKLQNQEITLKNLTQKFKTYDTECKQIQKKIEELQIKESTLKQTLNRIQSAKLEELLSKEEWVEGEGQDILDIDESIKKCEEKSLKYAEQNAINTKYGVISSFAQSNKEIIVNGNKIKVNKRFTDNLRNLIKVVKLDEKIIYQKREPITVKGINTYICKTKIKLKVKGIIQKKDLESILFKPKIKSVKRTQIIRPKRDLVKNKKKFNLGHFGAELSFGYAYSLYEFGQNQSSTDALSTNIGFGVGYIFFDRIYLGTGLGVIWDKVKTDYSFNKKTVQTQSQYLREVDIYTNFYKFTTMIFPFAKSEGYFVRGEYIGSKTRIGDESKISGDGYVVGFGKKLGTFGLEFRYTKSLTQDINNQNTKVNLDQYSLILSILLF